MFFFFQAEDGIRDLVRSRGLADVYKRQITPASDILEEMARRLPGIGGTSLQTEDEIAAIGLSLIHI